MEQVKTKHGLIFRSAVMDKTKEVIHPMVQEQFAKYGMTLEEIRKEMATYLVFNVGTVVGRWRQVDKYYDLLFVYNSEPGNGHFDDVLEYFEHACKRDKLDLMFSEVWNKKFGKHLRKKRGFKDKGGFAYIKSYLNM